MSTQMACVLCGDPVGSNELMWAELQDGRLVATLLAAADGDGQRAMWHYHCIPPSQLRRFVARAKPTDCPAAHQYGLLNLRSRRCSAVIGVGWRGACGTFRVSVR